jgi:heat shock protein HtpX
VTTAQSPPGSPGPSRTFMVGLATVPTIAAGLVLTAVLAVLFSLVGLLVGLVVTAAVATWVATHAAADPIDGVLRDLGARPVEPASQARLVNLAEGLSVSGGITAPSLHVVDDAGANMLVLGLDEDHAHVVVTTGLLQALERIELEGVLARAVTQIRRGNLPAATTAVEVLAGAGGGTALLARPVAGVLGARLARSASSDDDVLLDRDAVALTRYPPGLVGALRKLSTMSTRVDRPLGATAHLWLVDPTGAATAAGGSRASLAERIDALELL